MTGLSLKQIKEIFENKMRAEAQDFDSTEDQGPPPHSHSSGDDDRAGAIGMGEARVEEMIYDLVEAIDEMGQSNPDMTDAYIALFRALQGAGVSVKNVAMLAEGKKK